MKLSTPIISQSLYLTLAGCVIAGFPSPAEEVLQDIISFEEFLRPLPRTTILYKIKDAAMTGEGIMAGDVVVVETSRVARHGHIVLAAMDGEWIVRRLKRKGRSFYLESADQQRSSSWASEELQIGGVITAMVRRY